MFFPFRKSILEAFQDLAGYRNLIKHSDCHVNHFDHHLRNRMVLKIKESRNSKKKDEPNPLTASPEVRFEKPQAAKGAD